jgi:outer membrane receptor protein involved in Fe transport
VFLRNDYTYTGNLIEPFQFNFIRNLGTPGQANETFIYGVGIDGISYLQDGILINDRKDNLLDLNLVQSEDIETIEILPSPRGFLYSPFNNPVTVNFITRDFIPSQPYSRIKYYQGPYGEAMVDGGFNALFSRNFLFSFDVTNRKYDSSYTNTAFSTWMAKVRARYYFTSNLYLSATYNYVDKQTGNWQGVDADSILRSGIPLDDLLYEPDFAPVINRLKTE